MEQQAKNTANRETQPTNYKCVGSCKSALFFLIITLLFIALIGIAWLLQLPSKEEAFGGSAKLWDWMQASAIGWSPNYMLGHSLAMYHMAAADLFFHFIAPFRFFLSPLVASKLVALSYLLASAFTMFLFMRQLTKKQQEGELSSALAVLAYVTMPSILVAMGIYEHLSVTLCFVFVPLILRGILTVAEEKSPKEIATLGLAAAAVSLSYTKIAVVMSPILLLWTLEVLRLHPTNRVKILLRYLISAAIAALTSIFILLPTLREFGFAAGFILDPLEGWQHHYAFKSAVQWVDLWGIFMQGAGPNVENDAAMFAIGLIPLLAISLGLGKGSLKQWRRTPIGRWFLILVACWLISIGFAAGLDGIFLNHWNLLKTSQAMSNWSIPLLWLALFWLIWIAYQTAHHLIGGSWWKALVITFVFLFLPLFQLVKALPLFKDIRAPESFWSVGGFCVLAAAVGIVTVPIFTQCVPKRFVKITALLVGLLFFTELYPIHSAYWTRGLPSEFFAQYDQVLTFLKTAPFSGRVHPLSSRYFYLTIPQETGRALSTEALLRHFQLKGVRYLETAGNTSSDAMRSYLNLTGVAYIFIDKEDPLLPKQVQDFYRLYYPVVFENQFFLVLENQSSLYPAFLAHNFVVLPPKSYTMAAAAFQLAPMNLLTVEMPQVDQSLLGFAGMSKGSTQIELLPTYREHGGAPFLRVPLTAPRMENYNQMTYRLPPNISGWLTVTEAYHPDWKATIDGEKTPVYCAETALLSVYVPLGSSEIIFKFVPPFWYSLAFYIGILSWLLTLGGFLFLSSKWAPLKWRQWWNSH
ncbi:MAG: YfhO family protein [Chthoniobacterales bacterium]|nr:YfhO family protein [Chthoniobacterales bacterium]